MAAKIKYTPVGCHRPLEKYVGDLDAKNVSVRFKPEHAQIIIGIHTLEHCLDFSKKDQVIIYLNFIESCVNSINNEGFIK